MNTSAQRARDVGRFLGKHVCLLLGAGAATGLAFSIVELSFAFCLQAFLIHLDVMQPSAAKLPGFLLSSSTSLAVGLIIAAGLLRAALFGAQIYLQGAAQDEVRAHLRRRLLSWAYQTPSASSAEVFSLFNACTEAASLAVAGIQVLVTQVISIVAIGASLLRLSPMLSLMLGASLLLLAPPLRWTDRRTKSSGEKLAVEWERLSRLLTRAIKNLLLLEIYGTRRIEEDRAQRSLAEHHRHVTDYYSVLGIKVALPQALGVVLIGLVAVAHKRGLTPAPGILVSYLYLFLRLLQLFSTSNQAASSVIVNWPQTQSLLDWWTSNRAHEASSPAPDAAAFEKPVGWRLSRVTFAFPQARAPVLEDFSLDVPQGKTTVLMGPSGSGKSTLISLLLGAARPQAGEVHVISDGTAQDLPDAKSRLLGSVGYVGPESFLIEGSIRDNLLYGLGRQPADDEIASALLLAECAFVDALPRRLDHPLTEQGEGLSAGQKQRLSLARALLRRPKVLILDEATSNLDHSTEARLIATLLKLKPDLTIVAATHRDAILQLADKVVRLD